MAPRRTRPGPGQLTLPFETRHRDAPSARIGQVPRRNLRAITTTAPREELPELLPFDSSRVAEAGYSRRTKTLYVRFVDNTPWEYRGVEENIWRNFRRSASPGRFINRVLNSYDYGRSWF